MGFDGSTPLGSAKRSVIVDGVIIGRDDRIGVREQVMCQVGQLLCPKIVGIDIRLGTLLAHERKKIAVVGPVDRKDAIEIKGQLLLVSRIHIDDHNGVGAPGFDRQSDL